MPISETLLAATPLIFTGLAVALGFQCGLFNIGAEGQLYVGAMFGTFAGFAFAGLPLFIHLPLAIGAGFLGGALWGFIPGLLKARTGAHEVIVTIMLNYIAYRLVEFILKVAGLPARGSQRPDLEGHARVGLVPAPDRGAAGELGLRPRRWPPRSWCRGCSSARPEASSSGRSASTRRRRATPA